MLKRIYNPLEPYTFIQYGRMSDKKLQNERSPDQQFHTIATVIERMKYPWRLIETYRDDGEKGTFLTKRKDFQRMLREIELEVVKPNLIAVDTAERLGRADEIAELRRKLDTDFGIMVVTADKNFADPTGIVGKSVAMVENLRSTENTRITGHNVIRGKVDNILRGLWPGGPAPLGMRLRKEFVKKKGKTDTETYLELEPADQPYAIMAFQRAMQTGHGGSRLARWWNENPEIPARLKPISTTSMIALLKNELYIGRMVWGANVTGVVNDVRVVQPNIDGCHVTVDDYCEPSIDPVVFRAVKDLFKMRSEAHRAKRAAKNQNLEAEEVNGFSTQGRGLSLVYILSGLVRCECTAAMNPSSSGRKSNSGQNYVYYSCPNARVGACENHSHIREDRLRKAVVESLKRRLFSVPADGAIPEWYPELAKLIENETNLLRDQEPDRTAARKAEIEALKSKMTGWAMSLADPTLPASLRDRIAAEYDAASHQVTDLDAESQREAVTTECLAECLSFDRIVKELETLDEALAGSNVTMTNLVLMRHIARIHSTRDGTIELIGTWLGLFGDAVSFLDFKQEPPAEGDDNDRGGHRARVRTKLFVPSLTAVHTKRLTKVSTNLDPDRFNGFPDHYFWKEKLTLEETKCWAEIHAMAVAAKRRVGLTIEALATYFKVTPPTISHALRIARTLDPTLANLPKKINPPRWEDSHFQEVVKLRSEGWSVKRMSAHFGKSEPLIRAALVLAEKHRQNPAA